MCFLLCLIDGKLIVVHEVMLNRYYDDQISCDETEIPIPSFSNDERIVLYIRVLCIASYKMFLFVLYKVHKDFLDILGSISCSLSCCDQSLQLPSISKLAHIISSEN